MPSLQRRHSRKRVSFQLGPNPYSSIDKYTQAIALDPTNHVLYSNRSACYLSLGKNQDGLEGTIASPGNVLTTFIDALETIRLQPDWSKGYLRTSSAFQALDVCTPTSLNCLVMHFKFNLHTLSPPNNKQLPGLLFKFTTYIHLKGRCSEGKKKNSRGLVPSRMSDYF